MSLTQEEFESLAKAAIDKHLDDRDAAEQAKRDQQNTVAAEMLRLRNSGLSDGVATFAASIKLDNPNARYPFRARA